MSSVGGVPAIMAEATKMTRNGQMDEALVLLIEVNAQQAAAAGTYVRTHAEVCVK